MGFNSGFKGLTEQKPFLTKVVQESKAHFIPKKDS